jgi:tetratricopeptide (TPR) repeat protein
MAEDEELNSSKSGENSMLREAVEAVRQGDRARARDLLTRLLKADQNNATYWLWLSAVVESPKERLYCLQTALKLDPENVSVRRGLTLLGGLEPDEAISPFPMNRPRSWEENLAVQDEKAEKPRGWANPVARLFIILGIGIVVLGLFVGGYTLFSRVASRPAPYRTPTHRPTFTLSPTSTTTPVDRTATPTFLGPTPLSFFLVATYTPTPLYVVTEHPVLTRDLFRAGLRFMAVRQYETARVQFRLVLQSEPAAADAFYYIAETHRLEGNYVNARDAYQEAININANFAPAFVGRGMANLALNPDADVKGDFDNAITLDPQFVDAYIQRAAYWTAHGNPGAAIADLKTAIDMRPDSALAWMNLARAQLSNGENEAALASALRANQIDLTLVPVYLTLAQAYIATGQTAQAVAVLQTYTIYEPNDTSAFLSLGTAYNAAGEFQRAQEVLSQYIDANLHSAEAYYQRGLAYLNLNNPNLAEADFKQALSFDPADFDSHLGLARAYDMQGKPGDAYIQAEQNALPLAKTDGTKAQCYYWEAIFLEHIPDLPSATAYWKRMLQLPESAMPLEWRTTAFEHLGITPTPKP